ncbi:MAG: diguanylate cyclase [Pseudomonadota bacterium]
MINVTAEELETILATVDRAMDMHAQWREQLQRVLVCKMTPPDSDMTEDAHLHCAFGQWFYSPGNAHLRKLPAFTRIEGLHAAMHGLARELAVRVKGHWTITAKEYDPFIDKVNEFRDELLKLRQKVAETLHKIDPLTGAYNGQHLLPELRLEQEANKVSGQPCSLLLLRFDLLEINRRHGSAVGDNILRAGIGAVRQEMAEQDRVYRHRGAEFVICLPGKPEAQAEEVRTTMLSAIDKVLGSLPELASTDLQLHYGILQLAPDSLIEELINQAKLATYRIQI